MTPDELLLRLVRADAEAVVMVVDEQASALQHPAMTTPELLDGLELVGLKASVAALRAFLDL